MIRIPSGFHPVTATILLALAGCTQNVSAVDDAPAPAAPAPAVTLMTFNVENLFDNVDDPGKDDHTFLALADKQSNAHKARCAEIEVRRWREQCLYWDWNDDVVDRKLAAVAAAILQVNDGRGPDIVALQEIENRAILERLRDQYLDNAGYRCPILIEGDDLRGIDVAFLTRLELANAPRLHALRLPGVDERRVADTRGILEATFVLPDGSLLTGFSVHFPAPHHPTAMREAAYEHLNALRSALPPGRAVFAAGDFNTTSQEDREHTMLARFVRPHWVVAHEVGCAGCKGTSYYPPRDDWSFLDMILWSPGRSRGENTTWDLRANSVRIANRAPAQTRPDGTPWRFEIPGARGVSDHWPLVARFETQ